jgi:hypothetical protein
MRLKTLLLFSTILGNAFLVNGQINSRKVLLDKDTRIPVSNATIKAINCKFGTYSSENGNFEIPDSINEIRISCVGYVLIEKYKIAKNIDTIFISQFVQELEEVQVKNLKFLESFNYGIQNAKENFKWGPSGRGEEFAQRFKINLEKNQVLRIKKIFLAAKNFDPANPVLIHIYTSNSITKLPENELLSSIITVEKENFKGKKIEIDVSKFNVLIEQCEFFISFQWLAKNIGAEKNTNTLLSMTNELSEELTYSRLLTSKNYDWFPAPKFSKSNNPSNTMFYVEIEKYEK